MKDCNENHYIPYHKWTNREGYCLSVNHPFMVFCSWKYGYCRSEVSMVDYFKQEEKQIWIFWDTYIY